MLHALKQIGYDAKAWRIAGIYFVVSVLWIWLSDAFLDVLFDDAASVVRWSQYKGWFFVLATSIMLFVLVGDALRRIRMSQDALRTVVGTAMDAIVAVDAEGIIRIFNETAERLFECPADNAIGKPFSAFFSKPAGHAKATRYVAEGIRPDGTRFPVEASIAQSFAGDRPILTFILRDISERLAFEHEIRRLNRLHEARSRINQAMVIAADRDEFLREVCSVLVDHGRVDLAWVGRKADDGTVEPISVLNGHTPLVTLESTRDRYVCNDLEAEAAMRPWRADIRERGFRSAAFFPIRHADTDWGVLSVYSAASGFFQERELRLLEEVGTDISFALDIIQRTLERNEAQELAAEEQRFSDSMIESMPGILYFYDLEGHLMRWNRNFETVSGYSAEELAHMHPLDFFEESDKQLLASRIEQVFVNGLSSVEAPFLSKDGTKTPFFFTGRRVVFNDMPCLVGVGIDISDRLKMEEELRALNLSLEAKVADRTAELRTALVAAEQADNMKSAFLATMSHELRTPLNSIIGFTGILLQGLAGKLNAEQRKQMGMVQASARHLLELINDVLDISKIEAGQITVERGPFDLRELLPRVVASVEPMATRKGLDLRLDMDASIGAIESDERRVRQILINLLNNAIKFTDSGFVRVHAHSGDGTLVVVVQDSGIGIKAEDLDTLFKPFHQVDTGLGRQHEGTGLGLAICRRLADLLGGDISVQSTWNEGSTFTLELPLE
ncbi:MAG: PAS domain S-box protein [Rhodothermales bacterium]